MTQPITDENGQLVGPPPEPQTYDAYYDLYRDVDELRRRVHPDQSV